MWNERTPAWDRVIHGLVRKTAFIGKELTEVRRQPRLILSLVLGPFLILFLFGVGYSASPPEIRTVVVLPPDSQLSTDADQYRDAVAPPFVLVGVTKDGGSAQERLRRGEIGMVVFFPPDAYNTIAQGQRAMLRISYNEVNPLQAQWLNYYAYVQTNELNKRVLLEALRQAGPEGQNGRAAVENKQLAATMRTAADALRNDIAADRPGPALEQVAALRQTNEQVQRNLLSTAQTLGGVALFMNLQDAQNTPQGQALIESQQAATRIDDNLHQLTVAMSTGRMRPEHTQLVEQIQQDAATIDRVAPQLQLIAPEIAVAPFEAQAQNIAPVDPDFVEFYAPAVIALLVQHIAVTLTALTLVRERLLNSVELFRVTPTSALEITAGKYVSYFILTALVGAFLVLIMHLGLGVPILGGYENFVIVVALLIVASLSFGFFISAVSNSESQAVQLSMLVLLASVFFGGFFLDLDALLPFVRGVSYALPVTYGIAALRPVMLRAEVAPLYTLVALGLIGIVLFIISTARFQRQMQRG